MGFDHRAVAHGGTYNTSSRGFFDESSAVYRPINQLAQDLLYLLAIIPARKLIPVTR
jgi:hypothetical protein